MDLSDDRRTLRRLLRTAGVVGLGALAGCSSTEPGTTPSPTSTPPSTKTPTPTPPAQSTTSTTACETRVAELDRSIDRLAAEIQSVEADLETFERTETELEAIRDHFPRGWNDAPLDRARTTGQAIHEGVIVLEFETGTGTAWFIDDHHLVTAGHLIDPDPPPHGWTIDGDRIDLELVARDQDNAPDVAVLRTGATGTPLSRGSSTDLDPGTPVLHVGHPAGGGNWVTALGHYLYRAEQRFVGIDPTMLLYSSVPGSQRMSGAPLVTLDGAVVGSTAGTANREPRRPDDEPPTPAEPTVVDYEIPPKVWGTHVPIETVVEHYDTWV